MTQRNGRNGRSILYHIVLLTKSGKSLPRVKLEEVYRFVGNPKSKSRNRRVFDSNQIVELPSIVKDIKDWKRDNWGEITPPTHVNKTEYGWSFITQGVLYHKVIRVLSRDFFPDITFKVYFASQNEEVFGLITIQEGYWKKEFRSWFDLSLNNEGKWYMFPEDVWNEPIDILVKRYR